VLVLRRRVTARLVGQLRLLQLRVCRHAAVAVAVRQREHGVVERMEAGQGDELEPVTHGTQLALEARDRHVVEVLSPVERRRAVVGQQLAGERLVDALGELPRLGHVGRRGLAPEHVGVRRVRPGAGDRALDPAAQAEEALGGPLALLHELAVARVGVRHQQLRTVRVRARDQDRRHARHVGGEPRRDQRAHEAARGHQHLAAHVAALLLGGELVLEVDGGGACLDHRLHQLEGVQRSAEAGLGVGHDRREPVAGDVALRVLDLVGALQRPVDAAHDVRDAVRRVQALVRVGLRRVVRVGGHLPAGQVDRLEPRAHHLHRLVPGERAERVEVGLRVQQLPQPARAAVGQRVLDAHGAAQALDVLRRVGARDARPAPGRHVLQQVGRRRVLLEAGRHGLHASRARSGRSVPVNASSSS
jgi:hypothetical protein